MNATYTILYEQDYYKDKWSDRRLAGVKLIKYDTELEVESTIILWSFCETREPRWRRELLEMPDYQAIRKAIETFDELIKVYHAD